MYKAVPSQTKDQGHYKSVPSKDKGHGYHKSVPLEDKGHVHGSNKYDCDEFFMTKPYFISLELMNILRHSLRHSQFTVHCIAVAT